MSDTWRTMLSTCPSKSVSSVMLILYIYWQEKQCCKVSVLSQAWSQGWTCHQSLISCHKICRILLYILVLEGKKAISSIEYIIIWQKWGTFRRKSRKSFTDCFGFIHRQVWLRHMKCSHGWACFSRVVFTRTIHLFFYSLFALILRPSGLKML